LRSAGWVPLALAGLGVFLLLISGTGSKLGVWSFSTGFTLLRYAAYVGVAALTTAILFYLILRPAGNTRWMLLAALVLGVMTFTMPWQQRRLARSVPPIHDITTDLGAAACGVSRHCPAPSRGSDCRRLHARLGSRS
jgi:hypothetical protein